MEERNVYYRIFLNDKNRLVIALDLRNSKFLWKANKMRRFWRNVLILVPNILQFCKIHLISFPRGHRAHISSEIAFMQKTSYVGYRDSFTGWKSHPEMVYDVSEAWIFVKRKKKKKSSQHDIVARIYLPVQRCGRAVTMTRYAILNLYTRL